MSIQRCLIFEYKPTITSRTRITLKFKHEYMKRVEREKKKIVYDKETYPQIPPVLISNPPSKRSPSSVYAGFAIEASC